MNIDEAILARRSIRGFLRDKPVPRGELDQILEVAQHAPSNCNVQAWRLWVASGAARDRLSESMTSLFDQGNPGEPEDPIDTFPPPYRSLQVECGANLYGAMGVARDDYPGRTQAMRRNFEFFDAPHVAILCMDEHFGLGVALDVGTWLQSFMTLLTSRGIGSCAQAAMRQYPAQIREVLGIPDNMRILCGVAFGYEDERADANSVRQPRNPVETNVTFVG